MKSIILLAFVAVASTLVNIRTCFAQAIAVKPATVWYSEQFTFHSKSLERDFLIQVARPSKSLAGKVPVIYLLDGNSLFGEVADMVTSYGYFGDTAPAYVVGIGYPGLDFSQWLSLRNRDLLHVHLPDDVKVAAGSGDGAKFQKFLQQELRPMIERRYPIDPHRSILAGHSFGGLFTLHVLLNTPDAFNDYVICSPSIWAEPQLLQKASDFHAPDPLKVFIGIGSEEEQQFGEGLRMVKNAQELAARLRDHASGAEVSFTDFEHQTHGTVIAGCLSEGFRIMLPATSATASH